MNFIELIPEFLGTFALVFSFLTTGNFIIVGLTLATVMYLIGDLSGANINPVVSLVMMMNKTLPIQKFYEYIVVQILGGISAFYIYKLIINNIRN
jgi:hypothetical protein